MRVLHEPPYCCNMNTEINVQEYLELYLRNESHGCHFERESHLEGETNMEGWLIRAKADSRYLDISS